jgi:hypothetical protein
VLDDAGTRQIALVLLNKGDAPARFEIREHLQPGQWRAPLGGETVEVADGGVITATVPAHGVEVYVLDAPITHPGLRAALDEAMKRARRED